MTGPAESPPPAPRQLWATHVLIPTLWTPEQARAIVELLDDLREAVESLYAQQIQDLVARSRATVRPLTAPPAATIPSTITRSDPRARHRRPQAGHVTR